MLTVIKNIITDELENTNTKYVGVICGNHYNVAMALGDDEKEVHDETYFSWAVRWDYEGFIKIVPVSEIIIGD